MSRSSKRNRAPAGRRPLILVVEGLSGGDVCVEAAGGLPHVISPHNPGAADAAMCRDDICGVLLTGGGDVDPRLYGEKPLKSTYGVNETRDLVEFCILGEARRRGWPVLGICRGAQIMNVEAGGTLHQDITGHRASGHEVVARKGSILAAAQGHEGLHVVSLHHQEVAKPGHNLFISGRALDKTVEAIESRDRRCIGVQFHPEMDEFTTYSKGLFRWLVTESARRAKLPTPRCEWDLLAYSANRYMYGSGYGLSTPTTTYSIPRAPEKRHTVHRKAGDPTVPKRLQTGTPVPASQLTPALRTSWCCPFCAIVFDKQEDRTDHIDFIHGDGKLTALGAGRADGVKTRELVAAALDRPADRRMLPRAPGWANPAFDDSDEPFDCTATDVVHAARRMTAAIENRKLA
jgi:putative glutamine amidotransferase